MKLPKTGRAQESAGSAKASASGGVKLTNKEKVIIVAVAAIVFVAGVALLTLGAKPPAAPLPGEDRAINALSKELNNMQDLNSSALENLLKSMVG